MSSDATSDQPSRRKRRATDIDQLPPHSDEAEQGVLGCILLGQGNGVLTSAEQKLGQSGEAFYVPSNQRIYQTMIGLRDRNAPIDLISLIQSLKDSKTLDEVGGIPYLNSLDDNVPTAAHVGYYASIVVDKFALRKLLRACTEAAVRIYNFEGEATALVTEVQRDLTSLMAPIARGSTEDDWSFKELMGYDVANDPNAVIGWKDGKATRYLCRGYAAWIIGQSGIGKSSLGQQMALFWSLGRPFCGISPVRPLRVLVVQSENDIGDSAESTQGIIESTPDLTPDDHERLQTCFKVKRCRGRTGRDFCLWLEREVNAWQADLVYVDPLLRFAGIDVSRQDQCTKFLNDSLDPILARTGVVMIGAHHTGKPKSKQDTKGQTIYDRAYAGIGSSELVNWARAVTIVEARSDGLFEMLLAKRGGRAWATHPKLDEPTSTLYLKHSQDRIFWEQISPPQEPERKPHGEVLKGGRPNKIQEIASRNLHSFCAACKEPGPLQDGGETKNEVAKRLEVWLAKESFDASPSTCKRAVEALVANGKLRKTELGNYVKGPQA